MKTHLCTLSVAVVICWVLAPNGSKAQRNHESTSKWGSWSQWKPCSRTCGVGVSYLERECLDKEKPEKYCTGSKRFYRTCNIQDCPEGSRDFRLEQCEAYDSRTLENGRRYSWVPYIPVHEKCVLNCRPKGVNLLKRWADKVVDGTRCTVDSYDICVDGRCEKLGCDLILNSNAKEDKCRVCNGKGDTCRTHSGVNTEKGDGYKEIVVIPASATNINIQETAPSPHFLALSDSFRNYFLNGDYVIKNPAKHKIAGTVFTYERTRFGQERIFSLGPTAVPVHVEALLLGDEENPGISYEYSVPKSVTILPERTQFSWRTDEFDKCSASCAGGEQKRRVFCVRDDNGEEVSDSNCNDEEKPSNKQSCNSQPCPASWFISVWSPCSLTCGLGKQVRRVHCEHTIEGGETVMIPDEQCPGPKPEFMRDCYMAESCPEWSLGQWSECSVSCGLGMRRRDVTCTETNLVLPLESCNLAQKPKETEKCNPGPCTVTWLASNWSECYPKCGKGMSTRMVYCVGISNKQQKYPDELCNNSSRPIRKKECFSEAVCPAMWHASQWSKCTASCGVGMQMRNVMCAKKEGTKILRILSNDQCNKDKEMSGVKKCSIRPCQAGWYIYPWNACSKTCGQGLKRRSVKCFADSKEDTEEKWCKTEDKPASEEMCFEEECPVVTTPKRTTTTAAATTTTTTTTIPTTTSVATESTTPSSSTTEAHTTTTPPHTPTPPTTTNTPHTTTSMPSTTTQPATTTLPPTTTSLPSTALPSTTTTPLSTTTKPPTTTRGYQPVRIIQPPKDIMAYVGTEVLFRCRATGLPAPVISWRKGSIPVSSLDLDRIQMLPNGDLRVANITEEDNDVYTCIATNFVGPMETREARLAVIVPVSVSVSPNNATVSPGEDVEITCSSRGTPRPIVEWYKEDTFLRSQGRTRVSRTSVIITQVQPSDSGYYQCQARHNYGSASDKMYLNVVDEKEPTEPPFKCEDNPYIAHCQVVRQVNYCCIPYYQKACCKTCEDLLPDCTQ